jgi:hypothetical protein
MVGETINAPKVLRKCGIKADLGVHTAVGRTGILPVSIGSDLRLCRSIAMTTSLQNWGIISCANKITTLPSQ